MHRAVRDIHSEAERGKVLADAWQRYNAVNAISLGTAAFTWFLGRAVISGRSIDAETRSLVRVKDVLLGATLATSLVNMLSGREMSEQAPGRAVPVQDGDMPSPRTPERAVAMQRILNVMGPLNIALTAGVIGVTTILAMKSGRSTKWSFVSRFLP
ncbi:hypothetical protein SOCE26_087910 [Sorangium cellulosum]|uniref:Uncharacterized protein n=1 Tax=Sorangium cellulosum TaxID=56 RepID=A0A2L0F6V6_SORCE|nr:hypothetical protein [Sorangium cellulosum]AUX47273.1 hypothetical protein SOCE26_087910 [Sorangium cellulosum]